MELTTTVPVLTIVFIVFAMLAGLALPIVLLLVLRKKYKCSVLPFFVGCAVMVLFAFVIESILHNIILTSPIGAAIQGNIWLYGLYGGFMAGLFEEGGRFIAFKTVLRNKLGDDHNALMYGAGHGGIEAFVLLSIGMFNNLLYAVMMNTGNLGTLLASLPADSVSALSTAVATLAATSPYMFLVSILERLLAVTGQIGLSVIVWFAAKNGGKQVWLFPAAIGLHLLLDSAAVIFHSYVQSIFLTELLVAVIVAGIVALAVALWRKNKAQHLSQQPQQPAINE